MSDRYEGYDTGIDGPAIGNAAVTPSDDDDLEQFSRGIYVGGSGNLRLTAIDGSVATYQALPAGIILCVRARRIHSTGTTATNIINMY